jgi:hypothetical protein
MSLFAVEIEELVLDGFDLSLSEGRRLARLTESALARLLDQRGIASSFREPGAPVASIDVRPGTPTRRLAEQIAEALHRALDRRP